ncbi:extracellular solute-binding protein [Streptomyces monticola]|uniref:Extracellular solute-binding protein n=1 Tax=Streptomyces monticola TaxID=2666263 RepID=A0ABW2JKN5_9ACTN
MSPARRSRTPLRLTLAACLLATAALSTGGCADDARRTLVVLGPWTDAEEVPFEAALAQVSEETGVTYTYKGTRSLRETLVSQIQADAPPDVAILNSIGELTEYAYEGAAEPLPPQRRALHRADVLPWAPQVRQETYWIPVRIDLKSLVWTRPTRPGAARGAASTSSAPPREPARPTWCLGMSSGATSGWPGTDWIEDLLLQRRGAARYEAWATGTTPWTHPDVRRAWEDFGAVLGGLGRDRTRASLTTPYNAGGLLNPAEGRAECTHEHQGSFIGLHYAGDPEIRPVPSSGYLPEPAERPDEARPGEFEVSGDMAAVFKESDAAWDLLEHLTTEKVRAAWVAKAEERKQQRPFFPGNAPRGKGAGTAADVVRQLLHGARQICYDASDAMPPTLRTAFYNAVLDFIEGPRDKPHLDRLLKGLERERRLQDEDRRAGEPVFVASHLCENPPNAAAEPGS